MFRLSSWFCCPLLSRLRLLLLCFVFILPSIALSQNGREIRRTLSIAPEVDLQNPTPADILKIIDRMNRMTVPPADLLLAFQVLRENPSREGLQLVAQLLNEEIEGTRRDSQIIFMGLKVFAGYAREEDVLLLKEFVNTLSQMSEDITVGEQLKVQVALYLKSVTSIIREAQGRPGASRSLYAVATTAAGKNLPLREQLTKDTTEYSARFLAVIQSFLNEEIKIRRDNKEDIKIYARDDMADRVMDVLVRRKDRLPLLIGDLGVGRDKIVYRLVQKIMDREIPAAEAYQDLFGDAEILEINERAMARSEMSFRELQNLALRAQAKFGKRIILLLPEFDELIITSGPRGRQINPNQIEAPVVLSEIRDAVKKKDFGGQNSYGYVPTIFSMKRSSFTGPLADYLRKDFKGKYEMLNIHELAEPDIEKILIDQWLPQFESRYGVKIDLKSLELCVRNGQRIFPDDGRIGAAVKLLQDVAIASARSGNPEVTRRLVADFVGKTLGIPADPSDVVALQQYRERLKAELNEEVRGQQRMISDVVDNFISLIMDQRRGVRSQMILGPTGVGKTLTISKFAAKAFGRPGAVLEIQGSAIQEKEQLWTYFGAANGYKSADETKGIICDWLDDPARGKFGGVLVINEAEKACSEFFTQLMEFLDSGTIVCGDGKPRRARFHMVEFTSNRGASIMFPASIKDWTNEQIQERLAKLDSEALKKFFEMRLDGRDQKQLPKEIIQRVDNYTGAAPMIQQTTTEILQGKAKAFEQHAREQDSFQVEVDPSVILQFVRTRDFKTIGIRPIEREFESFLGSVKTEALYQMLLQKMNLKGKISVVQTEQGARLVVTNIDATGKEQVIELRPGQVAKLPVTDIVDPLNDPRFLELVVKLKAELDNAIFGQEDVLRSITGAIISHRSSANKGRPLSIGLVGTSGSGKSEIVKALNKILYGSPDRSQLIGLGNIFTPSTLESEILGVAGGKMGLFEQVLIGCPDGCVIGMDEFSNMGGNNPVLKDALLKPFYHMLEEGYWISPVTGTRYPLEKFIFLWTGNDGQNLFLGETADDMRLATWKEYRNRDKLEKYLLQAGIPLPLIGRWADVILMRPSTMDVMTQVVNKFLNPVVDYYKGQGVNLNVDKDFAEQVAFTFFRNETGARSIRTLIQDRLQGQIGSAAVQTKINQGDLKDLTFNLTMKDTMVRTRAYSVARDGERKVTSEIVVSRGDAVVEKFTEDYTQFARREFRYNVRDAAVTALHEAGHAVVNDPEQTGQRTAAITIIGGEMQSGLRYLGYARYEDELKGIGKSLTRQNLTYRLARLIAGQMAQILAGFETDGGWRNDLLKVRTLTARYALECGMVPGLETALIDENDPNAIAKLSEAQKRILYRAVDSIFADARKMARDSLRGQWNFVRAIASELMMKGHITGERMEELRKEAANKKAEWHVGWNSEKKQEQMRPGANETLGEKFAKAKNSCEVFLQRKILKKY